MRFNKQELMTLATQPSQKFDKEGVLFLRERQEGFFRRTERKDSKRAHRKSLRELSCVGGSNKVSLERWCRLRGNLLFYFKSREQWSEPLGVVILEQCTIRIDQSSASDRPYGFYLVFEGGISQHVAAYSEGERDAWLEAIQLASYDSMRSQLLALQQRMELRRGHDPDLDVHMWRLRQGHLLDPCEVPICEASLSCDNLLCDGHGRPPNPVLVVHASAEGSIWVKYAKTEGVERSSNPCFLTTITFRASDGLTRDTRIRITAYDVREHVSQTAIPIGSSIITIGQIQETDRIRIPLRSSAGTTVGFVTLSVWTMEPADSRGLCGGGSGPGSSAESTPCRAAAPPTPAPQYPDPSIYAHRRSQSLPPRLGIKLKLPDHYYLKNLFSNLHLQTYRFHSGLGGDICVHEIMAESRLCFLFPQQLLGVFIQEEKELLQEVAGMGELHEPWHSRQVELLDRHLHLLHLYSTAKEYLAAHKGSCFKPSQRKNDRTLEFAPINLHLQRIWVQNDTLRKSGFYDIVTVGAFTAHSHKAKNGGLIKLIQQLKESPSRPAQLTGPNKITLAHDAIQAIKQLRREVVEGMRSLMKLAREKQTLGMLSICEDMISKTRILLSLWDPGLVEEALSFVDANKVTPQQNKPDEYPPDSLEFRSKQTLSPYRRITQQLHFDLKSPDCDEEMLLVTPDCEGNVKLWPLPNRGESSSPTKSKSDMDAQKDDGQFEIFPDLEEAEDKTKTTKDSEKNEIKETDILEDEDIKDQSLLGNGIDNGCDLSTRRFLDTQVMCSSPSANYYKPSDEPEPWDITQLNIEASVMCLVSKVKFLCGRCGSPAVRLRGGSQRYKPSQKRDKTIPSGNLKDVVTSQPRIEQTKSSTLPEGLTGDQLIDNTAYKMAQAVNGVVPASRNKFTEGLDLDSMSDWTYELRPSMRKLRQAMDGLLKTARLTHSVFRVQEDSRTAQRACNVRYRRDVCFSQSLTALVTGLMARFWCQHPDPEFLMILTELGPIVAFEGLLSYYGDEIDMWGDMSVAIEDLGRVTFNFTRCSSSSSRSSRTPVTSPASQSTSFDGGLQLPVPRVSGSRAALTVHLPVPDSVYSLLPLSTSKVSFHVTPVFFNIGINEMATLAETLGTTRTQERSNIDNFDRLNEYYHRYRKLHLPAKGCLSGVPNIHGNKEASNLTDMITTLRNQVHSKQSKNVKILHLAAAICRKMKGIRFTSCKSAKDRTGMSVTLEQCQILASEYDLAEHEFQRALDCMRSEGCRRENTRKNIGVRKYAFTTVQQLTLPKNYRPPAGTYGSAQS